MESSGRVSVSHGVLIAPGRFAHNSVLPGRVPVSPVGRFFRHSRLEMLGVSGIRSAGGALLPDLVSPATRFVEPLCMVVSPAGGMRLAYASGQKIIMQGLKSWAHGTQKNNRASRKETPGYHFTRGIKSAPFMLHIIALG